VFGNQGLLGKEKKILSTIPDALVIINEGEEAMLGVITGKSFSEIPNLYYRNPSGEIKFTYHKMLPPENYIAANISIPSYKKKLEYLYRQVGFSESSRGCGKNVPCSYCIHSLLRKDMPQRIWRALNLDEVIKNILDIIDSGKKVINFACDDLFGHGSVGEKPESILNLFERLEELKRTGRIGDDVKFYASITTHDVYCATASEKENAQTIEILKRMRKIGFTTVFVGFESGARQQLKRYIKDVTPEENLKAIEILLGLGFRIDGGFIMFDPLMTLSELRENVEFLRKCVQRGFVKLCLFPFNCLRIIPGTTYERMFLRVAEKGKIDSKIIQLLCYIEKMILPQIPFFHFELFLQKLRTYYFLNQELTKINEYESKIIEYSEITLQFLKHIGNALEKDIPSDTLVKTFLNEHEEFLQKSFYPWVKKEIPEMFHQKHNYPAPERPHYKLETVLDSIKMD